MNVPSMEVTPPTPIRSHPTHKFPNPNPNSNPYTPADYKEVFLDFYTFLTTLHFNPADLQIPPPQGWPNITPDLCKGYKSNPTIDILRHLPYFKEREGVDIHYKSTLVDYSSRSPSQWTKDDTMLTLYCAEARPKLDPKDVIYLARGRESGGRDLLLDVQSGEIREEEIRGNPHGADDVKVFFPDLKEAYRTLKLIPCEGLDTIEAWGVEEREEGSGKITEEEVSAQTEAWETDLDVQYVRQIYREHGWPEAFRKDDAERALKKIVDAMKERGEE